MSEAESADKRSSLLERASNNTVRKRYGFNVLFAGLDKAPKLPWEKWQKQPQSDEYVQAYYNGMGAGNVTCWGFVTGYKNLVAIDFDWGWVYRLWKAKFGERAETLTVQTPNGGLRPHYLCERPQTIDKFKESLHVELKGPGRFVVFEGRAKRDDGEIGEYKVVNHQPIREDNTIITDTLEWLEETQRRFHFLFWNCIRRRLSSKRLLDADHNIRLFLADVMVCDGFGDEEIFELFRDFQDFDMTKTNYQIVYTRKRVEAGLKPPTCETLRQTLGWSEAGCVGCERKKTPTPSGKTKKPTAEEATVDKVITLAKQDIRKLLYDRSDGAFAVVRGSRHQEIHAIRSRQFERWLRDKYYQAEGRGLRREVVSDAVATLEAMAEFGDGKETMKLYNRVAFYDGAIYYDLSNDDWQVVKITPQGWMVVDDPPPLFRRFQHQEPQAFPEQGGSLDKLFTMINVTERDQKLMVKVLLCVSLIYGIPHPILILLGPQGCGKSITMRILREIIDPSRIPLLSFNYDRHETALMLHQHYAPFFDNVSTIPDWLSDILCRACTGDGFTKRQLYTDQDAVILAFKRCVGLNGIDVTPEKPDLMDRAIIIRLSPIPPESRKQETEIMAEFNENRAKIFGAILDALSKATAIFPTIDVKSLPRMADFAKWGEAVSRALGYEPNAFLKAYEETLGEQTLGALEVNPTGLAVIKLMERCERWQGKPSELLDALILVAEEHKIDTKTKKWPRNAVWLTRRMREIENNLRVRGIKVDFGLSGDRVLTITKSDGGGKSGKGGISTTFETTPQHAESNVNGEKGNIGVEPQGSGNTANTADTARGGGIPDFLWRRIPIAEKCELCGQLAVEYEINDFRGRQILRRCQSCFERMQRTFSGSVWKNVGRGAYEQ